MKKMKIMLLSFALLAIVGGALAFKAKNLTSYCTATPESGADKCKISGALKACPGDANGLPIQLTTQSGTPRFTYCYTIPASGRTDCKEADGTTDRLCITTTTSFKDVENP